MFTFTEQEIKILDIDPKEIQSKLEEMGAKKVFDADRVFTTFDTPDRKYTAQNTTIRLTEEDKLKLSIRTLKKDGKKDSVKVFTSRKQETVDFLDRLGLSSVAEVKSHRVSYELGEGNVVDVDIDEFPGIPPFVEIDLEFLPMPLEEFLIKLGLAGREPMDITTEEIYSYYGKDYFELFKI